MAVDISHFIGILKHEVAQYRVPVVDLRSIAAEKNNCC